MAEDNVKITIGWEYKDFTPKITLHEPKGDPQLWDMGSVKDPATAPIGAPIEDTIAVPRGAVRKFVLTAKNDSDAPVYFFAAPHHMNPEENSLGLKFKCLCVNHAFSIGPGETWYRVVEVKTSRAFAGESLAIVHTIIGIPKSRADKFTPRRTLEP